MLNCSNITDNDVKQAVLIRGISGTVCFILGVLTLIFEIVFLRRAKTNFLLRLFFYLTLSSTLFIGTFGLDLVHYSNYGVDGTSDPGFCAALGFFAVYTASVTLLFICAIIIILLQIVFKFAQSRIDKLLRKKKKKRARMIEVGFVAILYALPLLGCWIPLVDNRYGNNAWSYCWFKNSFDREHCDKVVISLEEILLFYVPNCVTSISSFACVVILISWFVWLRCCAGLLREKMKLIIKEMFLFIGFLGAYSITWLVFMISSLSKPQGFTHYKFWVVKALLNPIIVATIPSSFFFYICVKFCRKCQCKPKSDDQDGLYMYGTLAQGTTPPSTRISAPSNTMTLPFSNSWEDSEDSNLLVNS